METNENAPHVDAETLSKLAPVTLQTELVGGDVCWVTCHLTISFGYPEPWLAPPTRPVSPD